MNIINNIKKNYQSNHNTKFNFQMSFYLLENSHFGYVAETFMEKGEIILNQNNL
jgi:hypothetical protein